MTSSPSTTASRSPTTTSCATPWPAPRPARPCRCRCCATARTRRCGRPSASSRRRAETTSAPAETEGGRPLRDDGAAHAEGARRHATLDPSGLAAESGLQQGDVIEKVNGKPVKTAEELRTALDRPDGKASLVLVNRDGTSLFLTLACAVRTVGGSRAAPTEREILLGSPAFLDPRCPVLRSSVLRPLFVSQRDQRIDLARAPRGQPHGEERHDRQQHRHAGEHQRILRRHAEQERRDQPRQAERGRRGRWRRRPAPASCPATTTIFLTCDACAPSARRMPISCVRCSTEYAIRP